MGQRRRKSRKPRKTPRAAAGGARSAAGKSSVNLNLALNTLNILAEYAQSVSDQFDLATIETATTILNNSKAANSGALSEIASNCMNRLGVLSYHTLDELIEG